MLMIYVATSFADSISSMAPSFTSCLAVQVVNASIFRGYNVAFYAFARMTFDLLCVHYQSLILFQSVVCCHSAVFLVAAVGFCTRSCEDGVALSKHQQFACYERIRVHVHGVASDGVSASQALSCPG
eukprot:m.43971 g.43971  ORF g.43971 m.43971 type:complete len:127 (+) comp10809_c1_seq1:438-818(+)